MGKDKLRRFAIVRDYPHFFEPELGVVYEKKGKWNEYFGNDNPIVLELGCGKGEYAVGLAKHYPNKNFIGLDIKGSRMYIGAKEALENNIKNVAFCRTKIDFLLDCFQENEVEEIWLTFSDPQPNKPRKRLTSKKFIDRYKNVLRDGGVVHLKTDSDLLWESTLEQIEEHQYKPDIVAHDLYCEINKDIDDKTRDILHIQTHYEKLFKSKGSTIKYCRFRIH